MQVFNVLSHSFSFTFTGHLATANGAVALLDNFPSMDATEVAQAKAYGAIILAHGNMAEWAFTNAISIGSGWCQSPCSALVTCSPTARGSSPISCCLSPSRPPLALRQSH